MLHFKTHEPHGRLIHCVFAEDFTYQRGSEAREHQDIKHAIPSLLEKGINTSKQILVHLNEHLPKGMQLYTKVVHK